MKLLLYRFLFRQQWLCKLLGAVTPPVLVRLPEFKIYVRLNDFGVGLPIFLRRAYEPYVTTAICRFLKPGCVFVDIGANIGYHTLMAAARVGAGGSVIAFEPNPANCALLQKSIAANGFGNIRVHPNAVADHEGDVGLTRDAMDSSGVVNMGQPARCDVRVRAVTLDSALKDEARVDLIKMDIEGCEGRALRGMLGLLRRHRPVILSEFGPQMLMAMSDITPEAYLQQLRSPGYDLFIVEKDSPGTFTRASDGEILARFKADGAMTHLDLLALPQDRRAD